MGQSTQDRIRPEQGQGLLDWKNDKQAFFKLIVVKWPKPAKLWIWSIKLRCSDIQGNQSKVKHWNTCQSVRTAQARKSDWFWLYNWIPLIRTLLFRIPRFSNSEMFPLDLPFSHSLSVLSDSGYFQLFFLSPEGKKYRGPTVPLIAWENGAKFLTMHSNESSHRSLIAE